MRTCDLNLNLPVSPSPSPNRGNNDYLEDLFPETSPVNQRFLMKESTKVISMILAVGVLVGSLLLVYAGKGKIITGTGSTNSTHIFTTSTPTVSTTASTNSAVVSIQNSSSSNSINATAVLVNFNCNSTSSAVVDYKGYVMNTSSAAIMCVFYHYSPTKFDNSSSIGQMIGIESLNNTAPLAFPENFTVTQYPVNYNFNSTDPNATVKFLIQSKADSRDVYYFNFISLTPGCVYGYFLFVGYNDSQIAGTDLTPYLSQDYCSIDSGLSIQGQFLGFWNLK